MDIYLAASSSPYLTVIILFLVYEVCKFTYRLTLHPLAKFPGPKLTAISRWYEIYYEVFAGGQFYKQIEKMHEEYGPIVRVNPFEIHINDPKFYDSIFNFSPNFDKREFQMENLQHTATHDLHRLRRQVMGPFFSRQSVQNLEWLIVESVEKLCGHLQSSKTSKKPQDMALLYRSMTCDIIAEYAFAESYSFLDNLENSKSFFDGFVSTWPMLFMLREIPVVSQLMIHINTLPSWIIPSNPSMDALKHWDELIRARVRAIINPSSKEGLSTTHTTIFHELQRGKLPARDKAEDSICTNASLLITAGFETTGFALSVAHFHLLSNPPMLTTLKTELASAFAKQEGIPPWVELEKLPYLTAVLNESLRLSVGVMTRLQRINTKEDMVFNEWTLPKGWPIGMSQPMIHYDKDIFPEPWVFKPERWLNSEGEVERGLEKYLVSFSRGNRECLAKQLAKAELYLTLSTVFHRFDMELFETTRADVDPKRGHFVPTLEGKSNGMRILVK